MQSVDTPLGKLSLYEMLHVSNDAVVSRRHGHSCRTNRFLLGSLAHGDLECAALMTRRGIGLSGPHAEKSEFNNSVQKVRDLLPGNPAHLHILGRRADRNANNCIGRNRFSPGSSADEPVRIYQPFIYRSGQPTAILRTTAGTELFSGGLQPIVCGEPEKTIPELMRKNAANPNIIPLIFMCFIWGGRSRELMSQ